MHQVDPFREYQEALRKVEPIRQRISVIARAASEAGNWLQRQWQFVAVSGTSVNFPAGTFGGKKANIVKGEEWPTAETLAKTLLELHHAIDECQTKYGNIPQDDRTGIENPPSKNGLTIGPTG